MKFVFTGGETGGHFYPIIAVAESLHQLVAEQHLVDPKLEFIAPAPYDPEALLSTGINFVKSPAGKMRRYASVSNLFSPLITIWGAIRMFFVLLREPPDVVFSKGGYGSVPTVLAAHWLRIPIVVHESDSKPGRANLLAAKYAERIAVSYQSAITYFPEKIRKNIALTGIPVRAALAHPLPEGAAQELHLDTTVPTVLILGGSTGSKRINEVVIEALADLVQHVNIIHQTGKDNFKDVQATATVVLGGNANASRYHAFPYLSQESMREAAGAANLIISRAGSTSITEISLWKKPAILIPIPESVSHDQRTNAYSYAHLGAAEVLEEANLTPNLLASEVKRITADPALMQRMAAQGSTFANPGAARLIAEELLRIALSHNTAK